MDDFDINKLRAENEQLRKEKEELQVMYDDLLDHAANVVGLPPSKGV